MLGAIAVAFGGLFATASAAHAAELAVDITNPRVTLGYDPDGTGTEVDASTDITDSTGLTFHADWRVPGQSNDGDTFRVPVPTPFRIASSEPFTLQNAAGADLATCRYSQPDDSILCTIVGGPHADAEGDIWFTGSLSAPDDPHENPTWEVGGEPVILPTPHVPPPGPYTPPFGTYKDTTSYSIVDGKAQMRWVIRMWPGCDGPEPGTCVKEFTVSDQLMSTNPAMPHSIREGSFKLYRWDRAQNPDGTWATDPTADTGIPGSHADLAWYDGITGDWTVDAAKLDGEVVGEPVVSADGKSYTFHIDGAEVPHQYQLEYWSDADGVISLDNELFQNRATVNGEPTEAEARPRVQGGGGADAGAYASFVASKHLSNDTNATMPDSFELTATQGSQVETIAVPADGSQVNSPYFPANGGDITICEALPSVSGVVWAPYTITGTGVTGPDADGCYSLAPVGGQRIEIVVDNRATPAAGTFSVTKRLEAGERLTGLIGDADFTVEYTVGGVAQTPLTVKAGETVTSPSFPDGSEVELTEAKPEVFGVVWGPEVFSQSSFRIGAGENVTVELTNPAIAAKVSVGDYTWIDSNRDGIQDQGEAPLPGVELILVGPDGAPVVDVDGDPVAPQTTDENGAYLFENLPPLETGSYTVRVTGVPDGYFPTLIEVGDDRAVDSSGSEASSHLPLDQDGAEDLTLDFGFVTYEPEIDIVKTDTDGNDANTKDSEVDLTDKDGKTTLRFVVTNTGDEPLTEVELTDVTTGSGKIDRVSCEFPDGSTGTTWPGPLEPGQQIVCTAELSDVKPGADHRDEATVTAVGVFTGKKVSDDDPYHAKVQKPEEPVVPPTTVDPPLVQTGGAVWPYAAGGAALLALGASALLASRRRKTVRID